MGKGAVFPVLIDAQKPDNRREQHDGRFDEKIALLLCPRTVQTDHYDIGRFIGIRNVGQKVGMNRIAAVRMAGIVEIDYAELRLYFVLVRETQQVVVSQRT